MVWFTRRDLLPRLGWNVALFHPCKQIDLLAFGQRCEVAAEKRAAALVHRDDSMPVGVLQISEMPAKLAVDVVNYTGPCRARMLIGRNDLVAGCRQGLRFFYRQESPRTSFAAAGDAGAGRGRRDHGRLQELPPAEFVHGCHVSPCHRG